MLPTPLASGHGHAAPGDSETSTVIIYEVHGDVRDRDRSVAASPCRMTDAGAPIYIRVIIHPRHRHELRSVPVTRGKGQLGRRDRGHARRATDRVMMTFPVGW